MRPKTALISTITPLLITQEWRDGGFDLAARRAKGVKPRSMVEQFAPLKNIQVWRFALYYFFVFGAFVALALWLPQYMVSLYQVDVKTAGMLAATFSPVSGSSASTMMPHDDGVWGLSMMRTLFMHVS